MRRVEVISAAQNIYPSIPEVTPAPFGATDRTNIPVDFCNELLKLLHFCISESTSCCCYIKFHADSQNLQPRLSASTMAWSLDQKKFSSPASFINAPRSIILRTLSWTPANISVPPW